MSYTQIFYHIVFSTKDREMSLVEEHQEDLYHYIWGILKKKDCKLYRIGGMEDHIHILMSLHPSQALSDVIRDVKTSTSRMLKASPLFPNFHGWQSEYGAFTKSKSEKETVIQYIMNQKEHHRGEGTLEEFKRLLEEEGIDYDERYL